MISYIALNISHYILPVDIIRQSPYLYPSTLNGYSSVKQPSGLYLVPLHSVVAATPANKYEISILALLN